MNKTNNIISVDVKLVGLEPTVARVFQYATNPKFFNKAVEKFNYYAALQNPGWLTRQDRRRLTTHFAGGDFKVFYLNSILRMNVGIVFIGQINPVYGGQTNPVWPSQQNWFSLVNAPVFCNLHLNKVSISVGKSSFFPGKACIGINTDLR